MVAIRSGLKAGRYVNLWGPSVFTSPSNPFHEDMGRIQPFRELPARDFVEASYQHSTSWSSQLIANVGEGRQDTPATEDFDPSLTYRLDYFGTRLRVRQLCMDTPKPRRSADFGNGH